MCVKLVWQHRPELLLLNGPGTCIPMLLAVFILRACRLIDCNIVYIESICRVVSLSLSGRIASVVADSLLLQWQLPNQ